MLVTRHELQIEWGHCDPADIVYFPNYFSWFDNALMRHFEKVGLPKKELLRRYGLAGWPMIDVRGRFHKPSTYGDTVTIETRIVGFGRTSFEVEHKLLRGGELAVEGFEKRVLVARDADGRIKPHPIPAEVKALFEASP